MRWIRERQRWFNPVFVNAVVVTSWYFRRSKFGDEHLWLVMLPIILVVANGIFFASVMSRRTGTPAYVEPTTGNQVFHFPWRTKAVIFAVVGLFLVWVCIAKYQVPILVIFPLIAMARAFAECRRKIVISETDIFYRPPIGAAQRIALADSIPLGMPDHQHVFDEIVKSWKLSRSSV